MASLSEGGVALLWLREDLQVVTQAVMEGQAWRSAELILGEEGIGRRGLINRALSERLQVEFVVAGGYIEETGETILSLGPGSKGICVAADINVHTSLQGVVPENLGEGVGEFVAAVGVGKLKLGCSEEKARTRV